MEILREQNGSLIVMQIIGRLDTNAAASMMEEIDKCLVEGVEVYELDMCRCDYVASSGLRVILVAQKKMNSLGGTMIVKNVTEDVMEVFEMTGFADILTIE